MVSKIVEQQLKNCSYADLNHYNAETNTYLIPRYSKPQYVVGKCYLIKLSGELINNTSSLIAINWNNGNAPANEYYKAYINKLLGKMIYVDCLAFDFNTKSDLNTLWSGWLPVEDITQIGEIS